MKSLRWSFSTLLMSVSAGAIVAGCGAEAEPEPSKASLQADPVAALESTPVVGGAAAPLASSSPVIAGDEHPHKPGNHGGIIIPIGSDSYHAEAVIEKSGELRLLMLGKDESRIQEVDIQPVKAYVKAIGEPDATPVELLAVPQEGDSAEKTSQFVGQLPPSLRGRQLDVTIPNLRIAGERFRVGFTTATELHSDAMPARAPDAEEQALYLTPGGKYTQADILANGNMTAWQKFKGVPSSHDMFPKAGDRICPVTLTKANPAFTWIIDGKPYQFCCPPCVDEFVRLAKEQPEQLKDPDSYIKSESK